MSLYYGIARRLPSRGPLWEPSRWIRQELCRQFLDCGAWVKYLDRRPSRVIGDGSIVGACAVVTRDVPPTRSLAGTQPG